MFNFFPRLRDTLTRGFLLTQSPDAGRGRAAKVGKGVGELDLGFWMFNFFPRLRDTLTRGFLLTQSPDAGRGRAAKDAKEN